MLRLIRTRALALPLALSLAAAVPNAAWAAAPATKAVVEVDVALDQPDDEALAARLRGEIVKSLNAEGIAVTKSAGPRVGAIKLHVRWNADDNHEITAEVVTGSETKTPEGAPWTCDTCRETQLFAKVNEVLPTLVPLLPESEDAAAGAGTDGGAGEDPGAGGRGGGRGKLGPMGKAGIPLIVVGVGAAVTGGVLAGMGVKETAGEGDTAQVESTDFRKPGIPLAVVGGALAVTGVVLLAIDLKRSRDAKKKTAALAPVWTPGFAGVAVRGRF